jgi:hypothetical protein
MNQHLENALGALVGALLVCIGPILAAFGVIGN